MIKLLKKLIEVLEKESKSLTPQPIVGHFYTDLVDYIKDLTNQLNSTNEGIQKKLISKELMNIRRILGKIVDLRVKKILQISLNGKTIETKNLAEDELVLAESVSVLINKVNELKTLSSNVRARENSHNRITIRFLKPIPRIICADLKSYGPFFPEDVSSMPFRDAKKLIERKAAVQIEPFIRGS